jgi:hypothetical protein
MATPRRARSRPDPTTALFAEIASKGYLPMLHHQSGTIRIDLPTDPISNVGISCWITDASR